MRGTCPFAALSTRGPVRFRVLSPSRALGSARESLLLRVQLCAPRLSAIRTRGCPRRSGRRRLTGDAALLHGCWVHGGTAHSVTLSPQYTGRVDRASATPREPRRPSSVLRSRLLLRSRLQGLTGVSRRTGHRRTSMGAWPPSAKVARGTVAMPPCADAVHAVIAAGRRGRVASCDPVQVSSSETGTGTGTGTGRVTGRGRVKTTTPRVVLVES